MKRRTHLSRRSFLRGMLAGTAVSIGLPAFEVWMNPHGTAWADGTLFPTRFSLFMWGNGVLPERWIPSQTGQGDSWTLSEQLAGLSSIKSKLGVVTGYEVKVTNTIPHHSGAAGILTGVPLWVRGHQDNTFAAASIDQQIAAEIGNDTRFRSIEFGAKAKHGLSFLGPDQRNPPETSPMALFERLFGAGFRAPGEDTEPDPRLALRRSVLDAVIDDTNALKRDLSAYDQQRLEQHLDGIRELELRIGRLQEDPPQLDACYRPEAPTDEFEDVEGRPQLAERNRIMCDIAVLAMACDQTRVMSNYITSPLNNLLLAGSEAGHHQLTHDEPGDQPQVNAIVQSMLEEYLYMAQAMDGIVEGEGTLLDHSVLVGTSEISYGRTHSVDEFPLIYAGGAGGRLKTNIHHRTELRTNASSFMLQMKRATGILAGEFGEDEGYVTDGIGEIEA